MMETQIVIQRKEVADRIEQNSARLRSLIGARCGPSVLAVTSVDDIYQETIAEMMLSAHTITNQSLGQFFAWAGIIGRRTISRKLKAARGKTPLAIRRADSTGDGIQESFLPSRRRSPSSSAAGHEGTERLQAAIQQLPEHYREVIRLYKLEERPLAEVSSRLGKTKGATCRLVARASAALAEQLGE